MKNLIRMKYSLMVCTSTYNADQHARLLEAVFWYCFKEVEKAFVNVMVKHMMGHL